MSITILVTQFICILLVVQPLVPRTWVDGGILEVELGTSWLTIGGQPLNKEAVPSAFERGSCGRRTSPCARGT